MRYVREKLIMWEKAQKFLKKDKYLASLIEKYGVCTIKPIEKNDYFVSLVEAIVGQQLSGKAAESIFKKVKQGLKKVSPSEIIKCEDITLRGYGLSWAKVKYLKDLAHKVDRGDLNINKLSDFSNEKIIENLTQVKGIGRWTAEMFLMFSLARPDVFPIDDLGIKNGIRKMLGVNLEPEKIERFAKRWKPYRTVASWYVWRSLENK